MLDLSLLPPQLELRLVVMTGRMFSLLEEVVVVTDLQASLLASSEEFSPVCFTAITEKFFFFFYVELFQVEGTCDPMKNSLVYCVYFEIS